MYKLAFPMQNKLLRLLYQRYDDDDDNDDDDDETRPYSFVQ